MFNNNNIGGANNNRLPIIRQDSSDDAAAEGGVINLGFLPEDLQQYYGDIQLTTSEQELLARTVDVDHEHKPEKETLRVGDILKLLEKPKVREALKHRPSALEALGQQTIDGLTSENKSDRIATFASLSTADQEKALGEIVGARRSLRSAIHRLNIHARRTGYAALGIFGLGTVGLIGSTVAAGVAALAFMGTIGMMASGALMAVGVIVGLVVLGIISYQAAKGAPTPEAQYTQTQNRLTDFSGIDFSGIDFSALSEKVRVDLSTLQNSIKNEKEANDAYLVMLQLLKQDPDNEELQDAVAALKSRDKEAIQAVIDYLDYLLSEDNPEANNIPENIKTFLISLQSNYTARLAALENPQSPQEVAASAAQKVSQARHLNDLQRRVNASYLDFLNAVEASYPNPYNPSAPIMERMVETRSHYLIALESVIQYLNVLLTNEQALANEGNEGAAGGDTETRLRNLLEDYSKIKQTVEKTTIPLFSLIHVLRLEYKKARALADNEGVPRGINRRDLRDLARLRDALHTQQRLDGGPLLRAPLQDRLDSLRLQEDLHTQILELVSRLQDSMPETALASETANQLKVEQDLREAELAAVKLKSAELERQMNNMHGAGDGGGQGQGQLVVAGAGGGGGGGDDSDDEDGAGGGQRGGPVDGPSGVNDPNAQVNNRLDGLIVRGLHLENEIYDNNTPRADIERDLAALERDYERLKSDALRDGHALDQAKKLDFELLLLRLHLLLLQNQTDQPDWDKKDGSGGGPNGALAYAVGAKLTDARNKLQQINRELRRLPSDEPKRGELSAKRGFLNALIGSLAGKLASLQNPPPPPPPESPLPRRTPLLFGNGEDSDSEEGAAGGRSRLSQVVTIDKRPTIRGGTGRDVLPFATDETPPPEDPDQKVIKQADVFGAFEKVKIKLLAHLMNEIDEGRFVPDTEARQKELTVFLEEDYPGEEPKEPTTQPLRNRFDMTLDYLKHLFDFINESNVHTATKQKANTLRGILADMTQQRDTYYATAGPRGENAASALVTVTDQFMREAANVMTVEEVKQRRLQQASLRPDRRLHFLPRNDPDNSSQSGAGGAAQ